jgi:hypothetical protein
LHAFIVNIILSDNIVLIMSETDSSDQNL